MKSQKERPFQVALAKAFVINKHKVALCDVGTDDWPLRFSSSGIKPDLLVRLFPEDRRMTKVIGIETKTDGAHSISETLDGIQKIIALATEKPSFMVWESKPLGKVFRQDVSGITEYYLATPMSVVDGIVCRWEDTWSGVKRTEDAHLYATVVLNQLLHRYGGGILLKGNPWVSFSRWPCPGADNPV